MTAQDFATIARLVRLAVPIAVARLGIVGMGVVDTIVVGQLAPHELSHQALGWTLNGPALIGGTGLLLGVQVLAARAVGAGQPQAAGGIWRQGLIIAAAAGLVVCLFVWTAGAPLLIGVGIAPRLALPGATVAAVLALSIPPHLAFMASSKFLEALQRPTPGAITMWAGNALNLALNLLFVPLGGAIGSAWATVGSRVFLAVAIAVYILRAPTLMPLIVRVAARVEDGYRALLAIGAAAALSAMVEAGAFAAMSVIAARAGGEIAVATWVIATGSLVTLVFLIAQGLATAAIVLVSEAVGRGAEREAARTGWMAISLTTLAMAVCGAGCILFPQAVARAFTSDVSLIESLVAVMPLVALLMIPDGGQGAADAVLRAQGDNWYPTLLRMLAFVAVAPLLAFWLVEATGRGVAGVIEGILVASFAAFIAMLARLALAKLRIHRGAKV